MTSKPEQSLENVLDDKAAFSVLLPLINEAISTLTVGEELASELMRVTFDGDAPLVPDGSVSFRSIMEANLSFDDITNEEFMLTAYPRELWAVVILRVFIKNRVKLDTSGGNARRLVDGIRDFTLGD